MDVANILETMNELRPSYEPVLATFGSSLIFSCRSVTPDLFPTADAGMDTRDAIKGRSNVETEHGTAIGERRSGIVVDDVSNFFACLWTVDDPVVTVEWGLGAV